MEPSLDHVWAGEAMVDLFHRTLELWPCALWRGLHSPLLWMVSKGMPSRAGAGKDREMASTALVIPEKCFMIL